MKFKYIVAFENNSDRFDIGHCWIKVKVNAGVQMVFPYTAIQTVRSYILHFDAS